MLYIENIALDKDLTLNNLESIPDVEFENWDYGGMYSRRLIYSITEKEKVILVVNFRKSSKKILYWSISPYELIFSKSQLKKWAKINFDIEIPCKSIENGLKIYNQKNIHEGYFDITGIFEDKFNKSG